MIQYKIVYAVGYPSDWQEYITYALPKNRYDTEAEALEVIMQARLTHQTRRFATVAVETHEDFATVVEPIRMPEVQTNPDFTVIDNRDMGIQGAV